MNKLLCFIIGFVMHAFVVNGQTTFYDINTIQKIEVNFTQPDWDYQMDTARLGADGYVIAQWVKINNIQFDSVGVKYKGNSSYDSTFIKNPVHIELDHIINQSYEGYEDIKLSNGYADPSAIREVLAYEILDQYMDCPQSNFAQLYINGALIGLFSNTESINKKFCSDHFYSSQNTFFKCNPVVIPSPVTKSNLRHIPLADSTAYFNFYELKSDYGWNELVGLCDTITNYQAAATEIMDMDRVMWMLAFNSVLVNLDSYTGVFAQNYYIYRDNSNRFNPVVWDLNMAFGGFPYIGSGPSSLAGLTVGNMQQLSPVFHDSDPYWPLINIVMNDASMRKMYFAHLRTLLAENFLNNDYFFKATQIRAVADTAVSSDPNSFFTYTQFQNGLNTDYTVGSYTVPGITNLMSARTTYLQNDAEVSLTGPAISSIVVSNPSPQLNSSVDITATVTNSSSVFLGYRADASSKFVKIIMYDDGLHNDGNAGDNVFGAAVSITSAITQYYLYAENSTAGRFSPERAEHEFYSIQTSLNVPLASQVVFNEFLASNTTGVTNENGAHADWIELYNNTGNALSLFGLYLTDDISNPDKYAFPQGAIIQPNGYLVIWADENANTASYLHCNFKLSASGEFLMLSDGTGNVIDSLTFGAQSQDVSSGRCPNGTGTINFLPLTSFNASNCSVGLSEAAVSSVTIFPNPASGSILSYRALNNMQPEKIIITNYMGSEVKASHTSERKLDIGNLSQGLYHVTFYFPGNKVEMKKLAIIR